jgi:hypothetical protein
MRHLDDLLAQRLLGKVPFFLEGQIDPVDRDAGDPAQAWDNEMPRLFDDEQAGRFIHDLLNVRG